MWFFDLAAMINGSKVRSGKSETRTHSTDPDVREERGEPLFRSLDIPNRMWDGLPLPRVSDTELPNSDPKEIGAHIAGYASIDCRVQIAMLCRFVVGQQC